MKENILIAGGSGFLGQILIKYFKQKGNAVRVLSRNPKSPDDIYWNGIHQGEWNNAIEWCTVLINLSGKSVDCRYTTKNREEIIKSRIQSTQALEKAICHANNPPRVWLNASSATIYIHAEKNLMTEDLGLKGDDFSMNVCKSWEKAFFDSNLDRTRRVALRTSIVLGNSGGALPLMKRLAKFGLGGPQGRGNQYISWIHELDFCRAVEYCCLNTSIVGPINITSPRPTQNKVFMKELCEKLRVKISFNQPTWLLELGALIVRTETELLLKSRYVFPERLIEKEFHFKYPTLPLALSALLFKKTV